MIWDGLKSPPRSGYFKGCWLDSGAPYAVILSCARVETTAKSGEVIFHFKDAPHPARFGRARLRATKLHIERDHGPGMESFSAFFGANLNAISYKSLKRSPSHAGGRYKNG